MLLPYPPQVFAIVDVHRRSYPSDRKRSCWHINLHPFSPARPKLKQALYIVSQCNPKHSKLIDCPEISDCPLFVIFVQIETAFQPGPITRMDGQGAERSFKTICTLARLVHNPCMSSDHEGVASARTESEDEALEKPPSESTGELNPLSKRKKLAPVARDFTEINRGCKLDHTEICRFIPEHLAGIYMEGIGSLATFVGCWPA